MSESSREKEITPQGKETASREITSREITSQTMDEVVAIYQDTESIKETARRMKMSQVKVRKILLTRGLWSSPRSAEINELLEEGKTVKEVADILGITPTAVQAYMPYSKAVYGEPERSVAAVRAERYRERQKGFKEKQDETQEGKADQNAAIIELDNEERYGKVESVKTGDVNSQEELIISEMVIEGAWHPGKNVGLKLPFPMRTYGFYEAPSTDKDYRGVLDHEPDVYRLRLTLIGSDKDSLSDDEWGILKKYGKVNTSISRDILVSGRSTFHALHFMIQMLFGWGHTGLHEFEFTEADREKLLSYNKAEVENYLKLCGVYFRFPRRDFDDDSWDDDYQKGVSPRTWMRSKYSYPHGYPGVSDCWKENQRQVSNYLKRLLRMNGLVQKGSEPEIVTPEIYEEIVSNMVSDKNRRNKLSLRNMDWDKFIRSAQNSKGYQLQDNPYALREHLTLGDVFAGGLTYRLKDELRSDGETGETDDGESGDGWKAITYIYAYVPKTSLINHEGEVLTVGLNGGEPYKNFWKVINEKSEIDPEEAEAYMKVAEEYQKYMPPRRSRKEEINKILYGKTAEEYYRDEDEARKKPPKCPDAVRYNFQKQFMCGPFNEMTKYQIPAIADELIYCYEGWKVKITVEDVYTADTDWECTVGEQYAASVEQYAASECTVGQANMSDTEAKKIVEDIKEQMVPFFTKRELIYFQKTRDMEGAEFTPPLFFGKDRKFIDGKLFGQVKSVSDTGKPICIAKDGLSVMDEADNVGGYIYFLRQLHESSKEDRMAQKEWARCQGWTGRDTRPENLL